MIMAPSKKIALGIDLGTSNTCVAVYRNGKTEIIPSETGKYTTPSYVAFTDTERIIGEGARVQSPYNASNSVFDVKRLIGRYFDDEDVQSESKLWPFKVVNQEDRPAIQVSFMNEDQHFMTEQISAMILSKIKDQAEDFLGEEVEDAVITVPAYFNSMQRQATTDAGKIAGLNVLTILNEPTAAAIAYGLAENTKDSKNILIFDLGGGTFDVVVMTVTDNNFDVKAVGGDTHFGGRDIDNRLLKHFADEFQKKHEIDVTEDETALSKLRMACEDVKCALSSSAKTKITVDSLVNGIDFESVLTRARFDELCSDLHEVTLPIVEEALEDSGLSKDEIDDIVLVGGSTRIKNVQTLIQDFFDGKKISRSINPDEAVAHGAAIRAAVLTGQYEETDMELHDVTPNSLGIETAGGVMNVIIKRNTKVPVKITKKDFTTFEDNQTNICIRVYEGDNNLTKENELLGSYTMKNIKKGKRGVPKIDITFEKNEDNLPTVSAVDRSTNVSANFTVECQSLKLTDEDLSRMIQSEELYQKKDKESKKVDDTRNAIEGYCVKALAKIKKCDGLDLDDDDKKTVMDECNSTIRLLEDEKTISLDKLLKKMDDLKNKFDTLLQLSDDE